MMFRKSLLNVTLSDPEDHDQSARSISFVNISISSFDDSADRLLHIENITKSDVIVETQANGGCRINEINRK